MISHSTQTQCTRPVTCTRSKVGRLAVVMLLLALVLPAPRAHALHPDVRTVLRNGMYGTVLGTVAGLASYPFTGSGRGIFVGSSVGLYMGLAIGIYAITSRDSLPEAPWNKHLRPSHDDDARFDPSLNNSMRMALIDRPVAQAQFSLLNF